MVKAKIIYKVRHVGKLNEVYKNLSKEQKTKAKFFVEKLGYWARKSIARRLINDVPISGKGMRVKGLVVDDNGKGKIVNGPVLRI